jgi:hypothetical protein
MTSRRRDAAQSHHPALPGNVIATSTAPLVPAAALIEIKAARRGAGTAASAPVNQRFGADSPVSACA